MRLPRTDENSACIWQESIKQCTNMKRKNKSYIHNRQEVCTIVLQRKSVLLFWPCFEVPAIHKRWKLLNCPSIFIRALSKHLQPPYKEQDSHPHCVCYSEVLLYMKCNTHRMNHYFPGWCLWMLHFNFETDLDGGTVQTCGLRKSATFWRLSFN